MGNSHCSKHDVVYPPDGSCWRCDEEKKPDNRKEEVQDKKRKRD